MADPKCPRCYGTGSLDTGKTHMGIPIVTPCTCQMVRDIISNLNRAWTGLANAPKVSESPLLPHAWGNLYITATDEALRVHLRHVGVRMGWSWGLKVVSDADLMVAWLSNAQLVGKEILDPDVASVSSEKATLVDLIEPPDLLVVRLGVKAARNSAMNEVFLETILHRHHINRPIWVVDQPNRRLDVGHMCFSDDVIRALTGWDHIILGDALPPRLQVDLLGGQPSSLQTTPMSLGGSMGAAGRSTETRTVTMPTAIEKPKKQKFNKKGDR